MIKQIFAVPQSQLGHVVQAVRALSHKENQVGRGRMVTCECVVLLSRILRELRPNNVVSLVSKKSVDPAAVRIASAWTPLACSAVGAARYVPGAMFEHESPNKRIPARRERPVLVVFRAKTDWTGVEFDPGYPSAVTRE